MTACGVKTLPALRRELARAGIRHRDTGKRIFTTVRAIDGLDDEQEENEQPTFLASKG